MVRARAYRHDVRCPNCGSNWMRKYGTNKREAGHTVAEIVEGEALRVRHIVVRVRQ